MKQRLFTLGPDDEPLWVRLDIYPLGERWTAKIVAAGQREREAARVT